MQISDFDFDLPADLIAQTPTAQRTGSRLLCVNGSRIEHHQFADLPRLLVPGDLLVLNDTRVMRARLHGRKPTGGAVEILIERLLHDNEALAMIRGGKAIRAGSLIHFPDNAVATVIHRDGGFFRLRFSTHMALADYLENHGRLPLPPYISRADGPNDSDRYQTVYATKPGAVAAPTAGLHFDLPLLDRLRSMGISTARLTLHVGAGTFLPVRADDIAKHVMHEEHYDIPKETVDSIVAARGRGGKIVAVGTTTLRALESATGATGNPRAGSGETRLFIRPGYRFRVVDRLITNFHLPRSTLLLLVCAFAGTAPIRAAYAEAIAERYRFFSYGDAMLIDLDKGISRQ